MKSYLFDTNHLGAVLNRRLMFRTRLDRAFSRGDRVGTCIPALCEVFAGVEQSGQRIRNERVLRHFLREVRVRPLDESMAREFGKLHVELRTKGRILSQVDMMLAAMCRVMRLTLLTTDRDFEALPDVPTENWLAAGHA